MYKTLGSLCTMKMWIKHMFAYGKGSPHGRMIKTEEKAKVVAAVWGRNIFNSLPHYLFCLWQFWRLGWFHPFLSNHPGAIHILYVVQIAQYKTASEARNWINSSPQTETTTVAFISVFIYPSSIGYHAVLPPLWRLGVFFIPSHYVLCRKPLS